jgi:hypothetical protein
MEIIIGIIVVFVVLIIFGKIKGPPDPASMSIEALLGRVKSESSWIERYKSLPYENQQGAGIKKQFEEKYLYVKQLELEFLKRTFAESGKKAEDTMIPIQQRTIELMKTGMSEEAAGKQACNEFVQKRDAGLPDQPEKAT